jgi:hypothetical protein
LTMSSAVGARWRGTGFSPLRVVVSEDDEDGRACVGALEGLAKSRERGNCMPSVAMFVVQRPRGLRFAMENETTKLFGCCEQAG